MKKIDYINLAEIIRKDIELSLDFHDYHLLRAINSKTKIDEEEHKRQIRYYVSRKAHTSDLAKSIALKLNVDSLAFLKACGIE